MALVRQLRAAPLLQHQTPPHIYLLVLETMKITSLFALVAGIAPSECFVAGPQAALRASSFASRYFVWLDEVACPWFSWPCCSPYVLALYVLLRACLSVPLPPPSWCTNVLVEGTGLTLPVWVLLTVVPALCINVATLAVAGADGLCAVESRDAPFLSRVKKCSLSLLSVLLLLGSRVQAVAPVSAAGRPSSAHAPAVTMSKGIDLTGKVSTRP